MLSFSDNRREFLRVGGALGLSLPSLLNAGEAGPTDGTAKACIQLFLGGGPPQMDTWDPKPDAPAEVRGETRAIASATPGLLLGDLMPRTSRLTQRIAVLRAVVTNDNAHSSSGYYMTTGVPHSPPSFENAKPGPPNDHPALGAIVRKMWRKPLALPAAVTMPGQAANDGNLTWPGQDGGFLGRSADPWLLVGNANAPRFEIDGLTPLADLTAARLAGRESLRAAIDRGDRDPRRQQALDLVASPAARKAFDLNQEPARVRDRFGRTKFGQCCLLARRLVEAGVPLVRVNWSLLDNVPNGGHWDTHAKHIESIKHLMPVMDQGYSALLDDLADRGMLDSTLVMWNGEFGRTPKINPAAGRDHWGQVFSVAFAGGGVRGGVVLGASDKMAAYPKDGRVMPQDLLATVYHLLGLPPDTEMRDLLDRPLPISRGDVVRGILS